jgi:hypothetical protein
MMIISFIFAVHVQKALHIEPQDLSPASSQLKTKKLLKRVSLLLLLHCGGFIAKRFQSVHSFWACKV